MSQLEHTHLVNIFGERFQIKSDVPADLIEKIGGYVDYKIKEVGTASMKGDKLRIAVLAAMNIAGELFDARTKIDNLERFASVVEAKSKSLSESLDSATQTGVQ